MVYEPLKNAPGTSAQKQVNYIVAKWVLDHDKDNALLIVYFAGHGRPGKRPGELELAGRKSLFDYQSEVNRVIWNSAESNLLGTNGDVLQIFDCCFAGHKESRGPSSAFEYLAACGPKDETSPPGEESFTRALIWALKKLHTEMKGRFTTTDLCRKILEGPGFRKGQKPHLQQRLETNLIILHPLESPMPEGVNQGRSPTSANTSAHPSSPSSDLASFTLDQQILTLNFVFVSRPSDTNIRDLGQACNDVVTMRNLPINRIVWCGLARNNAFFTAVSWFKGFRHRKSATITAPLKSSQDSPSIDGAQKDDSGLPDQVVQIQPQHEYRTKKVFAACAVLMFVLIGLLFFLVFGIIIYITICAKESPLSWIGVPRSEL